MSSLPPVEAIVLAAGFSSRLGRPKALVEIGGRTILERIVRTLESAAVRGGVVVGGAHLEAMKAQVDPAPLQYARNPTPEAGRMGSVMIGLASTDPKSDVVLWPVDRPMARAATIRAMLERRETDPGSDAVLVPAAGGRRGHPILIGAGLRPALLSAAPDANLREVLVRAGARRIDVDVEDSGILAELDTEEDVERLAREWPRDSA